jgi:uncharacterized protein (DUF885 family)
MKPITLLLVLAACGASPASSATATPAASAKAGSAAFAAFVEDYFAAQYAYFPSAGTGVGLHQYDSQLEDRSRARIEARIAEVETLAARLAALDPATLSFDDAIDAAALATEIQSELLQLRTIRSWERNPMAYAGVPGRAINGIMKRDFAPAAERLRSIIARLRQVPAVYAAAKANLKNPPREFTDVAIRMSKGTIGFFEKTVPAWARDAAGGDAALLGELTQANDAVITAAKDFATWLETDLKPRSTGKYALGAETFAALLKADEMVDAPLADVLAAGEAQLAKDYDALVATANKIDPKKSPAQVMKDLSDDHPGENDLIPTVARSVEETRQFVIAKDIITIPSEVRPRVEETPPYARGGGFASMDTAGPFEDKATESFYYVTPVEKDWDAKHKEEHLRLFNRPVISLINIHEAFPGHYVQFLFSKRFPTKTRKLVGAGSNSEGWAHYAEQMVVDEGFGNGDLKIRLAQLVEALVRDCRYVVGIKLHTQGMTVEEGAKLFVDKAFMEPANAYEEARRGTFNPTYLYYTLGKLEIYKLRDEYRRKTGASLKQFHDAFVSQGSLPIPLVRRILLEQK